MKGLWLKLYAILVLLVLFLPLGLIVLFSFNASSLADFPLVGFTFDWYIQALSNPIFINAFTNSLIIASTTAVVSAIFGSLAAYGLSRAQIKGAGLVLAFLTLPLLTPDLIRGISLLSFYSFFKIPLSLTTVILGHIVLCTPYVTLIMHSRLHHFPWSIEEAARDLGANMLTTLRTVLYPVMRPTIIGAMLLVFAISFDEFMVAFFTTGSQSTLPMLIWSILRRGVDPTLNAISTVLLFLSTALLLVSLKVFKVRLEL